MAIVFTSHKNTQGKVFWLVSFLVLIILMAGSFIILLPEIQDQLIVIPAEGTFAVPDIKIDYSLLDSDRVKKLEPFVQLQTQFEYVATNESGKEVSGRVLADSTESAQALVESEGLKVSSLKESSVGRSDPFISYYDVVATPTPKK